MTNTERKKIDAICNIANIDDIGNLSDGFHTFNQLYYQRMILFAVIVKQNKAKAWKSLRHEDGELCFGGGWFIVGIDTPEGSYTYHYENKYFDMFDCEILDHGKHWDGHTEKDITRLLSLPITNERTGHWEYHSNSIYGINPEDAYCSNCGFHIDTTGVDSFENYNYCPKCKAHMIEKVDDNHA